MEAWIKPFCVPWVGDLPQYFFQVVYKLDKVRQAFDMFSQWVRFSWSIALPSKLESPNERRHGLQKKKKHENDPDVAPERITLIYLST